MFGWQRTLNFYKESCFVIGNTTVRTTSFVARRNMVAVQCMSTATVLLLAFCCSNALAIDPQPAQPAWIPPTPGWKIQPWESRSVGGGVPPDSVNYQSKAFTTPFATTGEVSRGAINEAFHAPSFQYAGASGGLQEGAMMCAQQCLTAAAVKANVNGKDEAHRKEMAEGCLEGCGVKNPTGHISTLVASFVAGDPLSHVGVGHLAWLGMMGGNVGGSVHPTTFAHESCYQVAVSGFTKEIKIKEAQTKLLGCNNFGTIGDLSLPHQACIMGVMNVLSGVPDATGTQILKAIGSKDCEESGNACSLRKALRNCDPLLFAGENPNVAAQAAQTAASARQHPGLYAGHAACYSAVLGTADKETSISVFASKFEGCQSGGYGSPAMPHHACVTGALSILGADGKAKVDDDMKKLIRTCDSFLTYGSYGHAYPFHPTYPHPIVPGVIHPGVVYPGMIHPGVVYPGMIQPGIPHPGVFPPTFPTTGHCSCYHNALLSLTAETKPEDMKMKFTTCGTFSYETPAAQAHQLCIMQTMGSEQMKEAKDLNGIKLNLAACNAHLVGACNAVPGLGTAPGSAASYVNANVHPLNGIIHPFAAGIVHGTPLGNNAMHCYQLAAAAINEKTTKTDLLRTVGQCHTGPGHQGCVVKHITDAKDAEGFKTALKMCEALLHSAPLASSVGVPYMGNYQSHQACYASVMGSLTDENVKSLPDHLTACAPLVGGNPGLAAHQTCIMNMLKNAGGAAESVKDMKALLGKCDAVLWSGGMYLHGGFEASAHTSCISTGFAGINKESKPEDLMLSIHACDHLAGVSPIATGYQQCLLASVKSSEGKDVNAVKADISAKCSSILGNSVITSAHGPQVNPNAIDAASLSGLPILQAAGAAGLNGKTTPLSHQVCYQMTLSTATSEMSADELAHKLQLCGAFALPGRNSPYGATAVSHQACITQIMVREKTKSLNALEIAKELLPMCDPLLYPGTASMDHIHMDNGEKVPFIPEDAHELPLLYPTYAVAPRSVHPAVVHPALGNIPPALEAILTQQEPPGGMESAMKSKYKPGPMLISHAPLTVHQAVDHPHSLPMAHHHTAASHYAPFHSGVHPSSVAHPAAHNLIHFKEKAAEKKVSHAKKKVSHSEKMSNEAQSLGIKVQPKATAKKSSGSVVANMLNRKPSANPYKKMMETPSELKTNSLFDRIASAGSKKLRGASRKLLSVSEDKPTKMTVYSTNYLSNDPQDGSGPAHAEDKKFNATLESNLKHIMHEDTVARCVDCANKQLRSAGRKLLSQGPVYGHSVAEMNKFVGNPLGDIDNSESFHQRDENGDDKTHELENILLHSTRTPMKGDDIPIPSRPMAMAKKFNIGFGSTVLSSSQKDGAEPLSPDGEPRQFHGNDVAETHLTCLLRCNRNKAEMLNNGYKSTTLDDDFALCLQNCVKVAKDLYPIVDNRKP